LIHASVEAGAPTEAYAGASVKGPLATFDCTERWVEHPARDGVILIGDAAGISDPTWGQGLSLGFRDVRVLRDLLLASEDWEAAGHAYAEAHDCYFRTMMTAVGWFREFFLSVGPEAEARRARARSLAREDPTRVPDHMVSGPDLPADETVRRRFFGEE
jgi:2-polyprenyl-6-methoxyphenol hydroxylase-like FAD-dependent oxidoreductase